MNRGTIGVNSLPKTVTGQRRGCDLNPGPTAPESSIMLTTRLQSHPLSPYIYAIAGKATISSKQHNQTSESAHTQQPRKTDYHVVYQQIISGYSSNTLINSVQHVGWLVNSSATTNNHNLALKLAV